MQQSVIQHDTFQEKFRSPILLSHTCQLLHTPTHPSRRFQECSCHQEHTYHTPEALQQQNCQGTINASSCSKLQGHTKLRQGLNPPAIQMSNKQHCHFLTVPCHPFQEWPQRHSYSGRVAASLPLPALVCRSNYRTCFAQTEFTTVHGQLLSCFSILLFGSNYQSQPSLVTFWLPPSFIPLASFPITEFTILRVCQGYSIFNSF